MLSASLSPAAYAGLGAIYGRGEARVFRGGFTPVGLGYSAAALDPGFGERAEPNLPTSLLADASYDRLEDTPTRDGERVWMRLPGRDRDGYV